MSLYLAKNARYNKRSEVQNMFKVQKGYDRESKTFRLPIEMIEQMEKLAAENNLSLNQLVVQCLNYALENLENTDHEAGQAPKK